MRTLQIAAVLSAPALAGSPTGARVEFDGEHPATLAVRIASNNPVYLGQVESAVEVSRDLKPGARE